jgi:hypothetical protein
VKRPGPHSTEREVWHYLEWLESEVERLSEGRFTEEELQALCHEQGEDCPERFARGCVEYNRKLFGDKNRLVLLPVHGGCGRPYHHPSCDCGGVGGDR